MAKAVIMPRKGQNVDSVVIIKWYKNIGDHVMPGDLLFNYETEKATFDEEAKDEGYLLARFYEEEDEVPCLANVCVIGQPGEDTSVFSS